MLKKLFLPILVPSSPADAAAHRSDKRWAFIVAIITTLLFFYPSFCASGKHVGYVFAGDPSGDAWHGIVAQFYIAGFYASHGIFSAIDFFTHDGASEYFLRPNYPVYHPLVLTLATFFTRAPMPFVTLMCVSIFTVHAFVGVYFLQRLGTRFFKFDAALAAFVAVGYVFSIQAVHSLWYLPYDIVAWMMPTSIYAGLAAGRRLTPTTVLWASVPTFLIFTSGYVALAVVAVAMSTAFIGLMAWSEKQDASRTSRLQMVLRSLMPCAVASLVAAPLYLGIAIYHKTVEIVQNTWAASLEGTAFAMLELPRNVLRLFAENLIYTGPHHELTLFWGLVPVAIFILYFIQYPPRLVTVAGASYKHRTLMLASLAIYGFSALIIFGSYSALSSVFYYFVPVAGYMHIYQRYLLLTHLFLMLFIGIMLDEIVDDPRRHAAKIMAAIVAVLVFVAAHLVDRQPWVDPAINNGFVVELLLALIFLLALILGNRRGILIAATICCFLVSLGAMYHSSDNPARYFDNIKGEQLTYDSTATNALVGYFRNHSTKDIIKYIDLIPSPKPYVPKNLPWFVIDKVKLSSYYGYEWHLGADWQYRRLMGPIQPPDDPDLAFRPDWEWLHLTGAEFALFEEGKKTNDPALATYVDLDPAHVYRFSGNNKNYVAAPLKFPPLSGDPVVFDNGYIRVRSKDSQAKVTGFTTNDAGNMDFTVENAQPASIEYLFWPNKHLHVSVDGADVALTTPDRLMTVAVPAGSHKLAIWYRRISLLIFEALYALYAGLLLAASAIFVFRVLKKQSAAFGKKPSM